MKAAPPGWEPHKIMYRVDGWVIDPDHEDRIPPAVAEMIARAMRQPGGSSVGNVRVRMACRRRMLFAQIKGT